MAFLEPYRDGGGKKKKERDDYGPVQCILLPSIQSPKLWRCANPKRMCFGSYLTKWIQVEGLPHQGMLSLMLRLLARDFSLFYVVFTVFFLLLVLVLMLPEFSVISF